MEKLLRIRYITFWCGLSAIFRFEDKFYAEITYLPTYLQARSFQENI